MTTPLIVPVQLEVFLVNQHELRNATHRVWHLKTDKLNDYMKHPAEPYALQSEDPVNQMQNNDTDPCVYVQWTLPEALTSTIEGKDGLQTFPLVPNRWLVVRFSRSKGTEEPALTAAWVVDSDFEDSYDGTSAYAKPTTGVNEYGLKGTGIGRNRQIQDWSEDEGSNVPLTALGPGLPAFAGYQPYNLDVFSFEDELDDLEDVDTQILDYLVVGWYSKDDQDILGGSKAVKDRLQDLDWVLKEGSGSPDKKSLYMGTALYVQSDKNGYTPSDRPDSTEKIVVAMGNNTAEAQAAVAERYGGQKNGVIKRLFQAFLTNNFDQLDDDPGGLDTVLHRTWFHAKSAGCVWQITSSPDAIGDPNDKELQDERDWLTKLNDKQRRYDIAERSAVALRQRIYDLWHLQKAPHTEEGQGFDPAAEIKQVAASLQTVLNDMDSILSEDGGLPTGDSQDELQQSIQAYADRNNLPKYRNLKGIAAPYFYTPNDPVILFGNVTEENLADSESTNPDASGKLTCRTPDQLLKRIRIDNAMQSPFLGLPDWFKDAIEDQGNWSDTLRDAVKEMVTECSLLSRAAATNGALTQDLQDPDHAFDPPGNPQPYTAYWRQPWKPAYIEWRIYYYPIPIAPDTENECDYHWKFQVSSELGYLGSGTAEEDSETPAYDPESLNRYRLYPRTDKPAPIKPRMLTGRSEVTSLPVFQLRARSTQHASTWRNGPHEALRELAANGDSLGQVSQMLQGLNLALQQRTFAADFLPADEWVDLLKPNPLKNHPHITVPSPGQGLPLPEPADREGGVTQIPAVSFADGQGTQAGQFWFSDLQIIDTFGRSLVFDPKRHDVILKSRYLTPDTIVGDLDSYEQIDNPNLYLQLSPRILQPSRLRFDFVDAVKPDHIIGDPPVVATSEDREPSPVIGLLLVNYLTGSLFVYDSAGRGVIEGRCGLAADGSLKENKDSGINHAVDWDTLPDCPYNDIDSLHGELASQCPELFWFIKGIKDGIRQNKEGEFDPIQGFDKVTAFRGLLEQIDKSDVTTKPNSADGDALAPLIGKPVALLRARLNFDIDSPFPFTDTSWDKIKDFPAPPYLTPSKNWRWNVRLGDIAQYDDGLIGYYTHPTLDAKLGNPVDTSQSTDYTVLRTVHTPTSALRSSYTQDIDASDLALPVNLGTTPDCLPQPSADDVTAYVTLLADPWRSIYALTDVLPAATLRLPDQDVRDPLSKLRLAFRMGPVLASTRPAPASSPRDHRVHVGITESEESHNPYIVLPSVSSWIGTWDWAQRNADGDDGEPGKWEIHPVTSGDITAHLDQETPVARTGYFSLTTSLEQASQDDNPSPHTES